MFVHVADAPRSGGNLVHTDVREASERRVIPLIERPPSTFERREVVRDVAGVAQRVCQQDGKRLRVSVAATAAAPRGARLGVSSKLSGRRTVAQLGAVALVRHLEVNVELHPLELVEQRPPNAIFLRQSATARAPRAHQVLPAREPPLLLRPGAAARERGAELLADLETVRVGLPQALYSRVRVVPLGGGQPLVQRARAPALTHGLQEGLSEVLVQYGLGGSSTVGQMLRLRVK